MTTLIEWTEQAALENLRFRLSNTETLSKDASTTFNMIIIGMAAAMAYVVKIVGNGEAAGPVLWVAVALALWLMGAASMLAHKCMMSKDMQAPTNEPMNLYQPEFELIAVREVELNNIQARIELVTDRNHRTAAWLDRSRLMALFTPALALVVWALAPVAH